MGKLSLPTQSVICSVVLAAKSYTQMSWAMPPLYRFQVRCSRVMRLKAIFAPSGE